MLSLERAALDAPVLPTLPHRQALPPSPEGLAPWFAPARPAVALPNAAAKPARSATHHCKALVAAPGVQHAGFDCRRLLCRISILLSDHAQHAIPAALLRQAGAPRERHVAGAAGVER